MKSKLIFSAIFIFVSVTEIVAGFHGNQMVVYIAKPLILISILIYSYLNENYSHGIGLRFFKLGLLFALFGDIFLMIREKDLFIPGLASFLAMQVLYANAFYQDHKQKPTSNFALLLISPFILFALILYFILLPHLSGIVIKIAVGIYALSIANMAWMALLRKNKVSNQSFFLVFLGAILFMISDSILAINKFINPVPFNTIWVMSTYCIAQYLISIGYLKKKQTGLPLSVSSE